MEINPSVQIEDMEGQPIPINKITATCPHCKKSLEVEQLRGIIEDTGKKVTLKSVCVDSLLAQYKGEENMEGMEKQKRGKLADKIYSAKDKIDLSAEEITELKKLIGKRETVLAVNRAYELLDPTPQEEKPE